MSVERRIERLERESRFYRRLASCLLLSCCASVACNRGTDVELSSPQTAVAADETAPSTPQVLKVQGIEVVNSNGGIVAQLQATSDGASLRLGSVDGAPQVMISSGASPYFALSDDNTGEVLISPKQIGVYEITSQVRKARVEARQSPNDPEDRIGSGQLDARAAVQLGVASHGGGIVDVYNTLGSRVSTIQSAKNNAGLIGVYKLDGAPSQVIVAKE